MSDQKPIIVGVDGSRSSSAAIKFAALEAKRLGAGIRLVHVVPSFVPMTPMMPLAPPDLVDTARDVLVGAEQEALALIASDQVSTALLDGPRVPTLIHEAEGARVVVLGTDQRPAIERLFTGSTVYGVAARATCPVVAVPLEWSGEDEHPSVVVGVKSAPSSSELIRRAFEIASERKAGVVLLHAWELPNEYDDLIASRVDKDEWAARSREAIERSLVGVRAAYAEVPVEIRVVHGQPARVLLDASASADLLLLARRRHAFPIGHLGGTGRALLREGRCPVEVLPPADAPADSAGSPSEQS